jgi:hypothetical protein
VADDIKDAQKEAHYKGKEVKENLRNAGEQARDKSKDLAEKAEREMKDKT